MQDKIHLTFCKSLGLTLERTKLVYLQGKETFIKRIYNSILSTYKILDNLWKLNTFKPTSQIKKIIWYERKTNPVKETSSLWLWTDQVFPGSPLSNHSLWRISISVSLSNLSACHVVSEAPLIWATGQSSTIVVSFPWHLFKTTPAY